MMTKKRWKKDVYMKDYHRFIIIPLPEISMVVVQTNLLLQEHFAGKKIHYLMKLSPNKMYLKELRT